MAYAPYKEDETTTAPALDEVGQLLLKAAGVVRQRGWCQGSFEATDGRMCAVGALLHAANCCRSVTKFPESLNGAVGAFARQIDAENITVWNDVHGRTAAEVVAAFEAAAVSHRGV